MGIIEEKKKKKENDIMESALTIFKEKGIEKTSIRDIMTKSGYGLGTFYLYFKDKEDLKEKVVCGKGHGSGYSRGNEMFSKGSN